MSSLSSADPPACSAAGLVFGETHWALSLLRLLLPVGLLLLLMCNVVRRRRLLLPPAGQRGSLDVPQLFLLLYAVLSVPFEARVLEPVRLATLIPIRLPLNIVRVVADDGVLVLPMRTTLLLLRRRRRFAFSTAHGMMMMECIIVYYAANRRDAVFRLTDLFVIAAVALDYRVRKFI